MTLKERAATVRDRIKMATSSLDPRVPMVVGGQTYHLEFDNRAAKILLTELDFNLLRGGNVGDLITDPNSLSILVHTGLRKHHPDITLDDVDSLVSIRTLDGVVVSVVQAVQAFYPDVSDLPKIEDCEDYEQDPSMQTVGSSTTQ